MTKAEKIALSVFGILALGVGAISMAKNRKSNPATSPEGKAILNEALKYINTKEIVPNKGWETDPANLTAKMKAAGWQYDAYCVTFVRMVLLQICSGAALDFFKKWVSVNTLITWNNLSAHQGEFCEVVSKPEAGCLVCYTGHTEILHHQADGFNHVITANSTILDAQGKEIEGIYIKKRKAVKPMEVVDGHTFLGYIKIKKIS